MKTRDFDEALREFNWNDLFEAFFYAKQHTFVCLAHLQKLSAISGCAADLQRFERICKVKDIFIDLDREAKSIYREMRGCYEN